MKIKYLHEIYDFYPASANLPLTQHYRIPSAEKVTTQQN